MSRVDCSACEAKSRALEARVSELEEQLRVARWKPWERANHCRKLRDDRLSGAQIARRLGLSKPYVNTLIRILDDCAPPLLTAFKTGDPVATTSRPWHSE